ncbi:MAG: 30S ribosomal protein S6 [Patescibacteria group bacterium]
MIYELLYIIPSKYSDTEIEGVQANLAKILEAAGAKIEKSEVLGKLKLAYPIKKERHGTYVLVFISLEEEGDLGKIDQDLRLSNDVLRHVIVKRPKGVPTDVPKPTSYQPPLTAEGKRTAGTVQKERKPKSASVQVPVSPTQSEVPAEKLSIEELDKKLDEILDDTGVNL